MEVEVKLHLTNAKSHHHVTTLLSPFHVITNRQHNLFFNGATSELSSRCTALKKMKRIWIRMLVVIVLLNRGSWVYWIEDSEKYEGGIWGSG
ncbi:unnamed protein product [Lathyrus oleraceus]